MLCAEDAADRPENDCSLWHFAVHDDFASIDKYNFDKLLGNLLDGVSNAAARGTQAALVTLIVSQLEGLSA